MTAALPAVLEVLRQLSATDFVSGEGLAEQLGVSRATIHNRLRSVPQLGLRVQRLPGRGYRLARPVSWLDADILAPCLSARGFDLQLLDGVDSTNSRLLAQALAGGTHKTVLAAEWQATGRGRRGRQWQAPLGSSLTFSLLWRFNKPMPELAGLSLAVGLGLAHAARALPAEAGYEAGRDDARGQVRVKWPNDVLHAGAKLAGILIEVQGDALGPSTAVIGVGLNVHLPVESRGAIDQPVADMADCLGYVPDRNALLCHVLAHLDSELRRFDAEGFAAMRAEWDALHAYQGRAVRMTGVNGDVHGRVRGVDSDGALLLETPAGVRRMLSGEVSLREAGS